LIIEVDGGHHDEQIADDARRSHWLESRGFRVIRFWNNQLLKEIEVVNEVIAEALGVEDDTPPTFNSSPSRGREMEGS
jgi:very-short-patch-repair endonuclease